MVWDQQVVRRLYARLLKDGLCCWLWYATASTTGNSSQLVAIHYMDRASDMRPLMELEKSWDRGIGCSEGELCQRVSLSPSQLC